MAILPSGTLLSVLNRMVPVSLISRSYSSSLFCSHSSLFLPRNTLLYFSGCPSSPSPMAPHALNMAMSSSFIMCAAACMKRPVSLAVSAAPLVRIISFAHRCSLTSRITLLRLGQRWRGLCRQQMQPVWTG